MAQPFQELGPAKKETVVDNKWMQKQSPGRSELRFGRTAFVWDHHQ